MKEVGVKQLLRLTYAVVVALTSVGSGLAQVERPSKVAPSDLSDVERGALAEVEALFRPAGAERGSNSKILRQPVIDLTTTKHLRFALDPSGSVRKRYLELLLSRIEKSEEIPATEAQQIEYVLGITNADQSTESELDRLKSRIRWHLRVRDISNPVDRIEFLSQNIDDLSDGYYYAFSAMDELTRLANHGAQDVLSDFMNRAKGKSIDGGLLQKAGLSVARIQILKQTQNVPPAERVSPLTSALAAQRRQGGVLELEFRLWLVSMLQECGPSATEALRQVGTDRAQPPQVRQAAIDALKGEQQ